MYRHGLRAEAKHTKWTDFDLTSGSGPKTFHVRRLKGSNDSMHTLDRDEVSALRKLKADSTSPFVFVSERGGPPSPDMIARIVEKAAATAKLGPRGRFPQASSIISMAYRKRAGADGGARVN
jgi:hypothetical protein